MWIGGICYILSLLQAKHGSSFGLYRDDGLGIVKGTPRQIENMKKDICKTFQENDLRITIEANRKVVNFLDVTLDLNTGKHIPYNIPYMKPNNVLQYVNIKSNHSPPPPHHHLKEHSWRNQQATRDHHDLLQATVRNFFERGYIYIYT